MSVFLIIFLVTAFIYSSKKLPFASLKKETSKTSLDMIDQIVIEDKLKSKQWINCDDVRDVISEDNKYYVGCLGGVLIVGHDGKVINQISMADGLGNSTVTSLVKKGDILYTVYSQSKDKLEYVKDALKKIENVIISYSKGNK